MNILKKVGLVVMGSVLLAGGAWGQGRTLVYTDHEPLGGMRTRFIQEVFFAAIEKESGGRLKIEGHWNGELSTSYDALGKVAREGTVDMAIVVPEYVAKGMPLQQIFKSFPVGPYGDKQVEFFRRAYADIPEFSEELKKANVESLLICTGYPVAFFGTKPLANLGDIRGTKWRTASFWHRDFLRNAGATPVTMPWNEGIYQALRDGSLDGLMVNVDSGYELKVHEVAPHILLSKDLWLGHVYLVVMNKGTWDGLAKEDQAAIRRAAESAYKTLGTVMTSSFDSMVEELRTAGAEVRVLTPAEVDQWKTDTNYRAAQSAWVKDQEAKGVSDARQVMERVRALLREKN